MKRFFRPETMLFLGLWLVLIIGGRMRFFRDPGTFWHVAVGNRLLDEGFFDTDPYSFTFGGQPWIPHQWAGEGAMAIVHRVLGFDGLLLGTVTILAGLFTGLGMRLMRAGLHPSVTSVLVASGLAASAMHFHIRPHLATMVGMAAVMIYLTDIEAKRISLRRAWWLVPICWLWANCHGGVLGGLATMAMAGGGWLLAWRLKRESPIESWRDIRTLLLVWFACFVVCFVNPYGPRIPQTWLHIYQMKSLSTIIEEHAPLQITDLMGITVLLFAGLYLLLFVGVLPHRLRVVWLLPIIWGLLAYTRIRHAPLFAIISLIAVADFFPLTRYAQHLLRKKSDLFMPTDEEPTTLPDHGRAFAVPAAIVGLAILFQLAGLAVPVLGRGWAQHDPKRWPLELLPALREYQYLRPTGTRIFNDLNFGGMLIHQTPGYRVFIDDRCELYGDEFLVELVAVEELLRIGLVEHPAEPFAEWQAKYGSFDMALVVTDGPFDLALAELPTAWEEVQRTPTATLYRKRE